jgi:hypothetical protein
LLKVNGRVDQDRGRDNPLYRQLGLVAFEHQTRECLPDHDAGAWRDSEGGEAVRPASLVLNHVRDDPFVSRVKTRQRSVLAKT